MRALLLSLALLALAACAPTDQSLPTLAPTLSSSAADAPQASSPSPQDVPPTSEASATPQASATPTLSATPQASATPTRRPTITPSPQVIRITDVPTATLLGADAASPESQATDAPPTLPPRTLAPPAIRLPYDPASALSAYGQVLAQVQDEHPNKQLFFISGEAQNGWTLGFIDPNNEEAQAIYQVGSSGEIQPLDLLVPLNGALRPFIFGEVRIDSPALLDILSVNGFSPSSPAALIYTLQADARGIVWEVQDTGSGERLAIDAVRGIILP